MKVLNSVLRVIPDDQFYAFNVFTHSSLSALLHACHTFLNSKLKEKNFQFNLLDESLQHVIEFIQMIQRKNSAQRFMELSYFYNQTLADLLRDEIIVSNNFLSSGMTVQNNLLLYLYKKVPIIFNLAQKKLIFSTKTTIDLSKPKDEIIIQRDKLLECSINEIMKRKKSEMQTRQWKIKFKEEETIDIFGVRREFITLLCAEICRDSMWNTSEDYKLYPNRDATDRSSLIKFEFFGRLLGKCLIESMLVDIRLTRFVYKKLLGKKLCYQDIMSIDAALYENNLLWIRDNDISEYLCLSFSVEDGNSEIELCPNGKNIAVTNDNKHEYLDLLVDFLLNKDIEKQLLALYKGFSDIVDIQRVQSFDEEELELILSGNDLIDIEDMRRNTKYTFGFSESDSTIIDFWNIIESFSNEKQRKLLQFVTGSNRVPFEGFSKLSPLLTIQKVDNDSNKLPSASTCFNLLKLPDYKNYDTLKNKLEMVLEEGLTGFSYS